MVAVAIVVGVGDGTELVDFETAFVFGGKCGVGTDVATSHTTDVECTKGKLGTGLTDSLSGDDTDRFAFLNHFAGSKVAAVAFGADAVFCLTGENGADFHFLQRGFFDDFADIFGQLFASLGNQLASLRMIDIM